MHSISARIKEKAAELGFFACGFTKAEALSPEGDRFIEYIAQKKNANLDYLGRNTDKRIDPRLILPSAQTVIGLLLNYYTGEAIPDKDNFIISRYAYGKDYHEVLKSRMAELVSFLKKECGSMESRAFVDSGTVMEKAWIARCGLGWQGKNTLAIHPERGSFFFIGIILTDLKLEYDQAERDHCGNCTRCVDACPTGALSPYQLDPSRCISNLTINKNAVVTENLLSKFNDRIFGCDICQEVCPFNRLAVPTTDPALQPAEKLRKMRKADWLALSKEDFVDLFRNAPVYRTGYEQLTDTIRKVSGSGHPPQR